MEKDLQENIAELLEYFALWLAIAHSSGEFGRLFLEVWQEGGMGLLSFPLPDAPRGGHRTARLHDWIREGFGTNDWLSSS